MATEEGEVGFEEGMSWLPSHFFHEACDVKVTLRHEEQQSRYRQQYHRRQPLSAELPPLMIGLEYDRQHSKYNPRPRVSPNWVIGGPGMQAVFIKSGHRSSGTGVFLPSKAGSNLHAKKKPACSPILLPAHVVEALNLNVHALGLGLNATTTKGVKSDPCGEDGISNQRAKIDDVCCILTHSKNSTGEICLPKEWSY